MVDRGYLLAMCGRVVLVAAVLLTLPLGGCTSGVPIRSPECNAKVNRCMKACAEGPESMSARRQTIYAPEGVNTEYLSPCERSCQDLC